MLYEARHKRELIGLAVGALYRQRRYIVTTSGEARRCPAFALGVVNVLRRRLEDSIVGTPIPPPN